MSIGAITDADRRVMMDQYHKELREGQLTEEFDKFKHYNTTFTSPNGLKQFTISLGELFDMFEIQRQKKTTYL